MDVVLDQFQQRGIELKTNRNLLPDDTTTLFVCSGMQNHKDRFRRRSGERIASLQSCLRTDDIALVGNGSHLTYFEMLGYFSFGNDDYSDAVDLWHGIVKTLRIPVTSVHVHPKRRDHRLVWETLGYDTVLDPDCVWSDGSVGGECCELYCGDLEIGNLVNPLGHSVDVGFGWERMIQVIENVRRIDQTSLFRQGVHPIVADHERAVAALLENGIRPGPRGRPYVCRRLLRRLLRFDGVIMTGLSDYLDTERRLRQKQLSLGRRLWKRFSDKPQEWWWETAGLFPEEIPMIQL